MKNDLVHRCNVVFELYKAALKNEITQEEFFKVKSIVERARVIPVKEIIKLEEIVGKEAAQK